MKILLDSHIMLWAFEKDAPHLSDEAKNMIDNPENEVYFSSVSIWELEIKRLLHPDQILYKAEQLRDLCGKSGFIELTLRSNHVEMLKTLHRSEEAPRHKDPFDKMLISQAKSEGMVFLTKDELLPHYGEDCVILV